MADMAWLCGSWRPVGVRGGSKRQGTFFAFARKSLSDDSPHMQQDTDTESEDDDGEVGVANMQSRGSLCKGPPCEETSR